MCAFSWDPLLAHHPTTPLIATANGRAASSFISLPLASVDGPRNGCLPQGARGAAGRGQVCRTESGAAGAPSHIMRKMATLPREDRENWGTLSLVPASPEAQVRPRLSKWGPSDPP